MLFPADPEGSPFLLTINLIAASLSIIGCLWMSWYCLRPKVNKTSALKLVLAIAISDLFYSFSNIMSAFETANTHGLCKVEGFFRQYFLTASICFTASTAILCYKDSKLEPDFNQAHFFRKAFLVSTFISLCLSVPPLFTNWIVYERKDLFCWVGYVPNQNELLSTNTVDLLVLMTYEGSPLLIGLAISIIGYTKAIRNTKKALDGLVEWERVGIDRLLWYPAVLFMIFIPSLLDNIIQVYSGPILWMEVIHLAIRHSIGFANALVYGLQRKAWCQSKEEEIESMKGINHNDSSTLITSLPEDLLKASLATAAL